MYIYLYKHATRLRIAQQIKVPLYVLLLLCYVSYVRVFLAYKLKVLVPLRGALHQPAEVDVAGVPEVLGKAIHK